MGRIGVPTRLMQTAARKINQNNLPCYDSLRGTKCVHNDTGFCREHERWCYAVKYYQKKCEAYRECKIDD